jgi:predicted dinucleotide-binding enzyme
MNIAIIGSGEIADTYGIRYASAGHEVYMASKEGDKTGISPELEAFDNIHRYNIEDAADVADFIIIATPPKDVREVSYWLGDVRHKVIIDATSNVHTPDDELVKTVCAIRAITGSQHIVKAFHAIGYEQLLKPLFKNEKVEMILVGDSKKAKEITKIIVKELGIQHFYDFGGDDSIPLFNEMTRCWRNLVIKNKAQNTPITIVRQ